MKSFSIKSSSRPNLFLIGAPKAGTSALADSLSRHPSVYCWKKEPRFFDAGVFYDDPDLYPILTIDKYLENYDNPDAEAAAYRLDASVFNMYSVESISRIQELNPDAKFILVLRDPVAASKSMFIQRLKYVREDMREVSEDFCECWGLLRERSNGSGFPPGCKTTILFRYDVLYHYERFVPDVMELVGREKLLILRYEDYKGNPGDVFDFILKWLGLQAVDDVDAGRVVNPSAAVAMGPWNRFLEYAVIRTRRVRHALGVSGKRARIFRRLVGAARTKKAVAVSSACDDAVKAEFEPTYRFLEEAERDGLITRIGQ
ncbi:MULTISPECIES: sulfotransferase [unclassified Thioalkalivibrio]|uniref:sulfotransferase family protein n=1 Tax=unclassified Thioalkalivibrio TaxID=2621013 RepID=UPI0009D9766A|nr:MULTISPECIES: sulfotransferase [unclassified Thioalkalivibrio]